jgi:hypothetical protein
MTSEKPSQEPLPAIDRSDEVPALPAPLAIDIPTSPSAARPSGARPPRRTLALILRLMLFVVVVAGLAAAAYFAWPKVYARYILPVQNNIARVAVLETHQQASQDQLFTLQTQLPALATSQAGQSQLLTAQASRMDVLEGSIKEHSQALAASQAEQAAAFTTLAPRVDKLDGFIKEHSQALIALQSTQTGLQAGDIKGQAELGQQVTLLKSMELLSRSRLFLYQSNFGLAKQDIQAARDLLAGLLALPDHPLDQNLAEVVQRLDQTLARLPDFPVAASGDLDIAWQILLGGQIPPSATPTPPAASENSLAATPEATGLPETPTPTAAP